MRTQYLSRRSASKPFERGIDAADSGKDYVLSCLATTRRTNSDELGQFPEASRRVPLNPDDRSDHELVGLPEEIVIINN